MASWRAPSSILEAPGLDFGASRPRFWSLQARLWSSWHNCLLCLAFSCFVLLSLAFSCCLLLSLTFSCLLLPALAFSCFLLLSLDSYGLPCAFRSIATQVLPLSWVLFSLFSLFLPFQVAFKILHRKNCEKSAKIEDFGLPKPSQNHQKS